MWRSWSTLELAASITLNTNIVYFISKNAICSSFCSIPNALYLLKTMTDEQKEIFEKFDDCWSEYTSYAEEAIFTYAFKLGMQIAIETLTE